MERALLVVTLLASALTWSTTAGAEVWAVGVGNNRSNVSFVDTDRIEPRGDGLRRVWVSVYYNPVVITAPMGE